MDVEKLNESSRPTENMTRPDGDKKRRGKETRGKSWDEKTPEGRKERKRKARAERGEDK